MKATDLIIPGAVVVGGYLVATKLLKLNPLQGVSDWWTNNPLGESVANWWNGLFGGGGAVPHLALSRTSANQGTSIGIAVDSLKPSTPLIYGWRELGFSEQHTSLPDGTWYGNGDIFIAYTTPPRVYTIYVDQRPWGGPYYQESFRVLQG